MSAPDDSTPIESLLRLAGERDQPAPQARERAREAAYRSWQRGLGTAAVRRPRRLAWTAAAAAALIAVAAAFWWRGPAPVVVEVARISALRGDVRVAGQPLATGAVLRTGDLLTTREGRAALTVGDALSLRVDAGTRLRFDAAGQVTLIEGAVYVDSGGLNALAKLRVDTPAGAVRHVGTQFQVRVRDAVTGVQVREGRVVLEPHGGPALDLGAGDLAELEGAQVRLARGQPSFGDAWEWAAATGPRFDIENRPLSEFLAWLAREHGWQLRYADAATESRARAIRLHGSLSGRDVHGMLERVSLVTGMPLAREEGAVLIGARP